MGGLGELGCVGVYVGVYVGGCGCMGGCSPIPVHVDFSVLCFHSQITILTWKAAPPCPPMLMRRGRPTTGMTQRRH